MRQSFKNPIYDQKNPFDSYENLYIFGNRIHPSYAGTRGYKTYYYDGTEMVPLSLKRTENDQSGNVNLISVTKNPKTNYFFIPGANAYSLANAIYKTTGENVFNEVTAAFFQNKNFCATSADGTYICVQETNASSQTRLRFYKRTDDNFVFLNYATREFNTSYDNRLTMSPNGMFCAISSNNTVHYQTYVYKLNVATNKYEELTPSFFTTTDIAPTVVFDWTSTTIQVIGYDNSPAVIKITSYKWNGTNFVAISSLTNASGSIGTNSFQNFALKGAWNRANTYLFAGTQKIYGSGKTVTSRPVILYRAMGSDTFVALEDAKIDTLQGYLSTPLISYDEQNVFFPTQIYNGSSYDCYIQGYKWNADNSFSALPLKQLYSTALFTTYYMDWFHGSTVPLLTPTF